MNEEQLKKLQEAIIKALWEKITDEVKKQVEELAQKSIEENKTNLEDIKDEVKKLKDSINKENLANLDEKDAKEIIAKTFKDAYVSWITTEKQFWEILDSNVKATYQNTITATDGLEFVFEQFSNDVFYILEKFDLVKELNFKKIKWKSISLPTYDGWVEAYWLDEWATYTKSKWKTWTVKIDLKKLGAMVSFTDEMLSDDMTLQTLYSIIIEDIGIKFAWKIEEWVISWAQTAAIKWILTETWLTEVAVTWKVENITDNHLVEADSSIADEFDINPNNNIAIMSKYTLGKLKMLRDANGNLTYPELREKVPIFLNRRVVKSNKIPVKDKATDVAGKVAVIFGNLRDFYWMFEKWNFEAVRGYADWDFESGKQTLRVSDFKGWKCKTIKAFSAIKLA